MAQMDIEDKDEVIAELNEQLSKTENLKDNSTMSTAKANEAIAELKVRTCYPMCFALTLAL